MHKFKDESSIKVAGVVQLIGKINSLKKDFIIEGIVEPVLKIQPDLKRENIITIKYIKNLIEIHHYFRSFIIYALIVSSLAFIFHWMSFYPRNNEYINAYNESVDDRYNTYNYYPMYEAYLGLLIA